MVLVSYEITVKTKATKNQGDSNAEPGAGSSSSPTQASLPPQPHGSTSQVDPGPAIAPPCSEETQETRLRDYMMNLLLLEQQERQRRLRARRGTNERNLERENNKRPLMVGEEQDGPLREKIDFAALRDDHLQRMALEQECEKSVMDARQHTAAHPSGSRNQGHDPLTTDGRYPPHVDPVQLKLLEQQNKRRLAMLRGTNISSYQHQNGIPDSPVIDSQESFMPEGEWERPGQGITQNTTFDY